MFKHIITLIFISSLLVACDKGSKKEEGEAAGAASPAKELSRFFYKKFVGKIGDNMPISMDITRNDTALTGHYVYLSKNQPIQLTGTIDSKGNVSLTEFVTIRGKDGYEDKETGKFVGKMDNATFKGTWSASGKSFPFDLSEKKEKTYAQLSYESHQKSYTAKGDEGKGEAYITASYYQVVNSDNTSAQSLINQQIMHEVLATSFGEDQKQYATIEEKMDTYISAYRTAAKEMHTDDPEGMDLNYGDDLAMGVEYNQNNILAFSNSSYTYMGGAHPNGMLQFLNFDLRTGKLITLNDILIPNYKAQLTPIAEKLFRQQNEIGNQTFSEAGYFDMDDSKNKFYLPQNYSIQSDGLVFTYQQYEIAAYAMGMPEVKIPYTEIKSLIKKEGLLAWVL